MVKTGKFYCLKQHFLLPSTNRKFAKIELVGLKNTEVVIGSDSQKKMNEYGKVKIKVLWAVHFEKRTFFKIMVKLLESNF